MKEEVVLGNVMVDCDDPVKLQKFYGTLLGWEMCELFDLPAVRNAGGVAFLFIGEPDYTAPIWPEEAGKQQKQMHFDFQVDDPFEAAETAKSLGAVPAAHQYGGEHWVTMLDPAGHPFCLCRK